MGGLVLMRTAESKLPFEAEEGYQEKFEEGVVGISRQFRLKRAHGKAKVGLGRTHIQTLPYSSRSAYVEGHRLFNGILAPLTC